MMVRAEGTSPWTSHTQIGASTGSSVPSSAASAAGMQARARGEAGKAEAEVEHAEGKQESHVVRRDRECAGCDAANAAAIIVPRQVAGVMRTWAKRRVMTVAMANMKAISSASPSPIGETGR